MARLILLPGASLPLLLQVVWRDGGGDTFWQRGGPSDPAVLRDGGPAPGPGARGAVGSWVLSLPGRRRPWTSFSCRCFCESREGDIQMLNNEGAKTTALRRGTVTLTVKWASLDFHFKFSGHSSLLHRFYTSVHPFILVKIYATMNKKARNIIKTLANSNSSHSQTLARNFIKEKQNRKKHFSLKSEWCAGSKLPPYLVREWVSGIHVLFKWGSERSISKRREHIFPTLYKIHSFKLTCCQKCCHMLGGRLDSRSSLAVVWPSKSIRD